MHKLKMFVGAVSLLSLVACNKAKVSESSSVLQDPQVFPAASGSTTCNAGSYPALNSLPDGALSVTALCFSTADLTMDAGGLPVIHLVGIAIEGGAFDDPSNYASFDITSHLSNFSGAQQSWIVEAAQNLKVPHVGVGGDSIDLLTLSSSMANPEDINTVVASISRNGTITNVYAQISNSSGTSSIPDLGAGTIVNGLSLPLW